MKLVVLLITIVTTISCSYFVSWDDVSKPVIGSNITEVTKTWGEPDEKRHISGEKIEYIYHLKDLDPTCHHTWIVNKNGVVDGYTYSGRCRPVG